MRFALVIFALLFFVAITDAQESNPKASLDVTPKIELRLTVERATIRPGERLKLRVELRNLSDEDLIIAQHLDSPFGNSTLSFTLQGGQEGQSSGLIGDSIPKPSQPDFEKTFVTNWLTLNKNHFYGTYIYLDPFEYSLLRKPGRYKLTALYYSRGIYSTPGWNGSFLQQADIEKLPFKPLQGSFDSNAVTITVRTLNARRK